MCIDKQKVSYSIKTVFFKHYQYLHFCRLVAQNRSLYKRLKDAWRRGKEEGKKEASKIMEKVFTEAQMQALFSGKRVEWKTEDMAGAIALHALSKKAYKFINRTMGIPLPGESTVRRWAATIQIKPGIQKEVLAVMGKLGASLSEEERLVSLCFDEVSLSRRAQYDPGRDAVVGPHRQAQVVMVRPLIGTWKQPFYFDFDREMDKELFLTLVEELYKVGFIVCASVCDLGFTNQAFLSEMGVLDSEETFCLHPSDETIKIFFFADPPHMLKLFRNHLIDAGYLYKGQRITPEMIRTVIQMVHR
jgi:hypothetical protein